MSDQIARLGITVDSSSVSSATKALQILQAAAAPAAAATNALTAADAPERIAQILGPIEEDQPIPVMQPAGP